LRQNLFDYVLAITTMILGLFFRISLGRGKSRNAIRDKKREEAFEVKDGSEFLSHYQVKVVYPYQNGCHYNGYFDSPGRGFTSEEVLEE
jgi:hypothetical protein